MAAEATVLCYGVKDAPECMNFVTMSGAGTLACLALVVVGHGLAVPMVFFSCQVDRLRLLSGGRSASAQR